MDEAEQEQPGEAGSPSPGKAGKASPTRQQNGVYRGRRKSQSDHAYHSSRSGAYAGGVHKAPAAKLTVAAVEADVGGSVSPEHSPTKATFTAMSWEDARSPRRQQRGGPPGHTIAAQHYYQHPAGGVAPHKAMAGRKLVSCQPRVRRGPKRAASQPDFALPFDDVV